ncbi:MAG: PIG-L family deacetylase [Kiritimatiellae bacterium]|nr:PIG-L family deacetylase [Kiritimatiellia bacterium]MDD5522594.1 PIG-L family deacetylase [Kiritimatiellia bacterium]
MSEISRRYFLESSIGVVAMATSGHCLSGEAVGTKANKTVMFFGAHADDMELRAGGTMKKFVDRGYKAISVMLTNNICGAYVDDNTKQYFSTSPAETTEIRHREARDAAKVLGVEIIFMDFKENSYWNGTKRVFFGTKEYEEDKARGREALVVTPYLDNCINDVAKVILDHSPEIIMTHSISNCNPEHCAAAHLVHNAFLRIKSKIPDSELWFTCRVQSPSDVLFLSPDVLIDTTKYHDAKFEALRRHKSQRIPLDRVMTTDEYWGKVAGVKYAEPFKIILRGRSF